MTDGKTTQAAQSYFARKMDEMRSALHAMQSRRHQIADDLCGMIADDAGRTTGPASQRVTNEMTVGRLIELLNNGREESARWTVCVIPAGYVAVPRETVESK